MKKLIISLIAGAVLLGAGVGVLFMEIAEFTTTDYLPYIKEEKLESFSFKDSSIFADNTNKAEIDIYLGEYFDDMGSCQIVEDKSVEGIDVEIIYRGEKPAFNFIPSHHNEEYTYYSLSCYADTFMPKDILDAAKYMFNNKIIVKHPSNYYVEKVVIKTNHPELIMTSY